MSRIQTLHKIASPLLYKTGLYQMLWQTRARKAPFTFVAYYHRVVEEQTVKAKSFDIERGISASVFERQMRFLLRHFSPVKASRAQDASNSAMQFAVTLDDGYEDNYSVAAPILKQLGIPATFYVVSDYVGTDRLFWWEQVANIMNRSERTELNLTEVIPSLCKLDTHSLTMHLRNSDERDHAYGQLCAHIRKDIHANISMHMCNVADYFGVDIQDEGRHYGLMDWMQLKDLARQGFEIGCHTATHCNIIGTDEAMLKDELINSVILLENQLDSPIESFAYPYGLFEKSSKPVLDALAETNCRVAYTTQQGVVESESPAFELPRAKLNRSYDFACAYNIQDTLNNTQL